MRRTQLDLKSAKVEIKQGDEVSELTWKKDFLLGGDAAREEVSVTAPVVFVGHGVVAPDKGYDDYADVDVEGKIVFWISGAPASFPSTERAFYSDGSVKSEDAVKRGAVGVLAISTIEMAKRYPWERITKNAGSPGYRWLDEEGKQSSFHPELKGGAFLSHEAATRLFAASPKQPKQSILFLAVTAEEKGLLGAEYFVHNSTVPVENIVANVNLDMPLFLYPLADVTAFGEQHSSLSGPVAKAAKAAGFEVTPDPMPEEVIFIRSDQYPFVQMGIPAIYFNPGWQSTDPEVNGQAIYMEFLTTHYHTPSDDLTRPVHWESAEKFALANYLLGLEIANDWERPTWNEGDFFGEKFGR